MARRIASVGALRVPGLTDGLRATWAYLADGLPGMRSPTVDALNMGESVALDGGQVWSALYRLDPDNADHFRRSCGWRPGEASAWLAVDNTRWNFDPRTELLSPAPQTEGENQ